MELNNTIQKIRINNNLTQDQFAEQLHVTRQAVSRWENGETTPSIETLKSIADIFKIDGNALLGTNQQFCQSCGMPLMSIADLGTNQDKGASMEYCTYCLEDGKYKDDITLEEMAEGNLNWLKEWNELNGTSYTKDEARPILREHLTTLKRWKAQ
jgi:transcriptional regulator with XRE-family HTH domain